MRILSVRFKNLNSLVGEWEVDFTHAAYSADGIFAITGPTGAGKTTLLDAICLALYGQTPRLKNITQSNNEIMSRQTGECFAEVTFSTQHGTFCCHWSQHRARKLAGGKLQNARHEIADAITGKIIDSQIRTVAERIVNTTGMDFERFTQSMMLAQGGFAAFLKASADERAPILEQITGTGIYSDISRQVHVRHTETRNTLLMLESELNGMQLLSLDQEAQYKNEEHQLTTGLTTQQAREASTREQRDWKKLYLDLHNKADKLTQEHANWQTQDAAFLAQRETLNRAIKTLELSATYASLTSLRAAQHSDEQQLTSAVKTLPALEEKTAAGQQLCIAADATQQTAENALRDMRPVFKQVHLLDQQISQCAEQQSALSQELSTQQAGCQQREQAITILQHSVSDKMQQLMAKYPEAHGDLKGAIDIANDALAKIQAHTLTLTAQLADQLQGKNLNVWREQKTVVESKRNQLTNLHERLAQQKHLQSHIDTVAGSIKENAQQLAGLVAALADNSALVNAHEKTLAALRQQQIQQQRILSLEEQRRLLLDGEACPLCGSTEHPFADHVPATGELEANIDKTQDELTAAQQRLDKLGRQQIKLQTQYDLDTFQYQRETAALKQLEEAFVGLLGKLAIKQSGASEQALRTLDQSLLSELKKIQLTVDAADNLESDIRHHEKLETHAIKALSDTQSIIKDIQHISSTMAEHRSQLTTLNKAVERLNAALAQSQAACFAFTEKRQALLGNRNADQQEAALESAFAAAQTDVQLKKTALTQAQQELRDLTQNITTLEQRIHQRNIAIRELAKDFVSKISAQGFKDEDQYLAARLGETERQQLQNKNDALTRKGIELQAAIQHNQQELSAQLALKLSDASLDTLQQQLSELELKSRQWQEQLGGVRQTLRNNEQQRLLQHTLTARIDQQKIDTERWGRLHELIGSADGKKFRNFAQGLTFDMMIAHANQQLQKMSERYLLQRDALQPLDLNVIDNFQAGEVRSTKNLSGGESFVVSLALALGLSRMASRNVRVDSLFLDEGFGTLDEEALDTALETLTGLQQEGKLIGVISHVSALKERIATQIKVDPMLGGRSRISGPGCRQISS